MDDSDCNGQFMDTFVGFDEERMFAAVCLDL